MLFLRRQPLFCYTAATPRENCDPPIWVPLHLYLLIYLLDASKWFDEPQGHLMQQVLTACLAVVGLAFTGANAGFAADMLYRRS